MKAAAAITDRRWKLVETREVTRDRSCTLARVSPEMILAWRSALAFLDAFRESRLAARLLEASDRRVLRASASSSFALRAAVSSLTSWTQAHCQYATAVRAKCSGKAVRL